MWQRQTTGNRQANTKTRIGTHETHGTQSKKGKAQRSKTIKQSTGSYTESKHVLQHLSSAERLTMLRTIQ